MKDKYVGDIGDYGKNSLLRAFLNAGVNVGVNWYSQRQNTFVVDYRCINRFMMKRPSHLLVRQPLIIVIIFPILQIYIICLRIRSNKLISSVSHIPRCRREA